MGLLGTLLTIPVAGPVNALVFIAEKVREQAMKELLDEDRVQQQLLELELRRELGEISPEEHAAREEGLLEQLDAIRQYWEEQEKGQDADG